MIPPSVRIAGPDARGQVARVLTDAFSDEAGLNYWLRQGRAKDRARTSFFDAATASAIHPKRVLHIAEDETGAALGGAIWLNPGDHAYEYGPFEQLLLAPRLLAIAGIGGMKRGLDLGERLAHMHPKAPHAHLAFLGVAPQAQGRGVGSAMLKAALAPLDASGVTAFLECSTERNAALYARHGFEEVGRIALPGLTMWAMVRSPRG